MGFQIKKGFNSFECEVPENGKLTVYRNGNLHYVRNCKTNKIIVNTPLPGFYTFEGAYKVEKIQPKIYKPEFTLPPAERFSNFSGEMKIIQNNTMNHTPARIFTASGIIEVNGNFKNLPEQFQAFILLHEFGHNFYSDETKTDMFALYNFGLLGYSLSQALYCLVNILKRPNPERVNTIFNLIPKK